MNTTTNKETIIESEEFVQKSCGENNCRSDDRDDYHCHEKPAPQSIGGMMIRKMIEQYEKGR
jgi:hypothetical protein